MLQDLSMMGSVTGVMDSLTDSVGELLLSVVKSKRSLWRLNTIADFFWAIVNFIGVFFTPMFSMEKSDSYRKGSGLSKKWDGGSGGGPGGSGRGPYGGGGPPRGLDNVQGIDHSEFRYLPVFLAAAEISFSNNSLL